MTKYDFLKGYKPSNEYFTTNEEVETITKALGLKGLNEHGIQWVRDYVVMTYSDLRKDADNFEERDGYMTAMQSVTAVVDHYRYTHNMDV